MQLRQSHLAGISWLKLEGKKRQQKHQEVEDVVIGALPQRGSTPRSKSAHHVLVFALQDSTCDGRSEDKPNDLNSHDAVVRTSPMTWNSHDTMNGLTHTIHVQRHRIQMSLWRTLI